MAKKLKIAVAEIEQYGDALVVPNGMSLKAAIEVLTREYQHQEEVVDLHSDIPGFVPDAAYAMFMAMKEIYGWAHNVPTPGFFGDTPPDTITVVSGLNTTIQVPWGMFKIPGIDSGYIYTDTHQKEGRATLRINGHMRRKYEDRFNRLVEGTKQYLKEHSVYRGKAFRIRLKDEDGDTIQLPEPKFLDINRTLKDELVFPADVENLIRISLFAPIRHRARAREINVPSKRGVLLHGTYGTGKSMTSTVVADIATEHGWTYILCERATELVDVLRLAREYSPAVVFCEDVDKVLSGQRTMDMDELLNVVDGVETKNSEIMVIFTTNNIETINKAALRPGRLDAVIEVQPPDAEAVKRLIYLYGRGLIDPEADITAACELLAGEIPSSVQEAVERSKLAVLDRDPDTALGAGSVTAEDLLAGVQSMRAQLDIMKEQQPDERSEVVKAAEITAGAIRALNNGHAAEVAVVA